MIDLRNKRERATKRYKHRGKHGHRKDRRFFGNILDDAEAVRY
jgi:hypothetical protein